MKAQAKASVEETKRKLIAHVYRDYDDSALLDFWIDYESISLMSDEEWNKEYSKGDVVGKALLELVRFKPTFVKDCLYIRDHKKQWGKLKWTFWFALVGLALSTISIFISCYK